MLSVKTWKYMQLTLTSGYNFGVYTYKIERKGDVFEFIQRKDIRGVKIKSYIFMFVNFASLVGYFLSGLGNYVRNEGKRDIIINMFLVGVSAGKFLFIGLQLWHLYFIQEIISVVYKFVHHNQHLCEVYHIPIRDKGDRYDCAFQAISIIFLSLRIGFIPGLLAFFYVSDNGITDFLFTIMRICVYFIGAAVGLNEAAQQICLHLFIICGIIVWSIAALHGGYCAFLFANCALMYTNSTQLWMEKLSKDLTLAKSEDEMLLLRKTYKQHLVMNKCANNLFSDIVEFALYVSSLVLTLSIYGIFRLANQSYTILQFIIVGCGLIIIYFLKSSLVMGASCYVKSLECCTIGIGALVGGEYEKRFWSACKPTSISVGSHFTLKSKNYVLQVFGKIIFENVVNLLLAF